MAIVLTRNVDVFDGISQFSARPAVIELHDDDTFVLAKIDPATNAKTEIVFQTGLSDLTVGGSSAMLTFTVGGVKKRVDFSFAARAAMAVGGVAGLAASAGIVAGSGINDWLAAFRAKGVTVKYLSQGKIVLWSLLGTLAVVVVIGVVIAIVIATQ
jgi:hypothetical protein